MSALANKLLSRSSKPSHHAVIGMVFFAVWTSASLRAQQTDEFQAGTDPVVSSIPNVDNNVSSDNQWFEVANTNHNLDSLVDPAIQTDLRTNYQVKPNGEGDKMYFVEQGDNLGSIALAHTGRSDNRQAIAEYNGFESIGNLETGTLVLIPKALLASARGVHGYDSRILEFDPENESRTDDQRTKAVTRSVDEVGMRSTGNSPGKSSAGALATASVIPVDVVAKNIDLFVGQVSVFGKVSVDRVAVGSGAIVRAEVLKTGELLVIAQSEGSTSLRLWHKDGSQSDFNIRVGATDPETRFHMEKMVLLRVKMVEFRKSVLGKLGIEWGDSVAGPTFATAGDFVTNSLYRPAAEGFTGALSGAVKPFSSYFGIASSLASRINFLSTTGDAVVLAEPTLSCANGGNAKFLAGGEVPYPTVQANGQTSVEFKEYGIRLDISPRIDTAGNVQTSVMTEISSIDPAVTVMGAPGLLTRRTETQVNVRSGETIVIAGLLKSENSKDIDKIPGIGNLPILGRLFKSENMRNDITELVIFITPEVVSPESGAMSERHRLLNKKSADALISRSGKLNLKLLE